MRKFAQQYLFGVPPANTAQLPADADIFLAYVINQKAVNQNSQQALAIVVAQILNLVEAQFGFATNDDSDHICT